MNQLSRRDFFCSLAASVVVAKGISYLPIGFPEELRKPEDELIAFLTRVFNDTENTPDIIHVGPRAYKMIIGYEAEQRSLRG